MPRIITLLSTFLHKHIFYCHVLWWSTSSLGNAAYNQGYRDKSLPHQVISPEKVDEFALTFSRLVDIYSRRSARSASLMILISLAAFWRHTARTHKESIFNDYELICTEAAKELARKEYAPSENILGKIEDPCSAVATMLIRSQSHYWKAE